MNKEDAQKWLKGEKNMRDEVARKPFETFHERVAKADLAKI